MSVFTKEEMKKINETLEVIDGILCWSTNRPASHFNDARSHAYWVKMYAGKEAGTTYNGSRRCHVKVGKVTLNRYSSVFIEAITGVKQEAKEDVDSKFSFSDLFKIMDSNLNAVA